MPTLQAADDHRPFLLLFLLAALIFFSSIGTHDIWPADEPRFAEVAQEMMQSGDYLVPRVNGLPYKEKPPLLPWGIALASLPFGEVNAFSARLPSAVGGLITLLCTYLLAARLFDRRVAFWSALILLTTQRFWWQSLTAQTDMLLTACMSASLLFFQLWQSTGRRRHLVFFYLAIAGGLYAKGPPALLFPALLVVAFTWRRPHLRRGMHWFLGLLAVLAAIALWLIPARLAISTAGSEAAQGVLQGDLFKQIIGRVFKGESHSQPPWYYLINLPLDLLPWSLFLPWTIPWVWRRRKEGEGMRLLLSWAVPAFIFFSASIGKRAVYLVPIIPVLAILFSRSILDLVDEARRRWLKGTGIAWLFFLAVLGAAPWGLWFTPYRESWQWGLALFSVAALGCAAFSLRRLPRAGWSGLHRHVAAQTAALLLLAGWTFLPFLDTFKSARGFCEPVRTLALQQKDFALYSLGFTKEEFVLYSRRFHTPMWIPAPPLPLLAGYENSLQLQKQLRSTLARQIKDPAAASPEQVTEALRQALVKGGVSEAAVPAIVAELEATVAGFFTDFAGGPPGFIILEEENWPWIRYLAPGAGALPILRREGVGSRDLLLLANPAGLRLLEETGGKGMAVLPPAR